MLVSLTFNFGYKVFKASIIFGYIGRNLNWGILGYFVDFFSGILVFHYPPPPPRPTLNRGYIEDERHFLMYCPGHDNIRNELHSLLSTHGVVFKSLNDTVFTYPRNGTTSKIVGKYTYLMFQKRKDILNSKYNQKFYTNCIRSYCMIF